VIYGLSKSSNYDDLGCIYVRVIFDCILFQMGCFVVATFLLTSASCGPFAIAELLVYCVAETLLIIQIFFANDLYKDVY